MNSVEIAQMMGRLKLDLIYLETCDDKLRVSLRLGARWQGSADMAYMLGRTDMEQASRRCCMMIDAACAHLRGASWKL